MLDIINKGLAKLFGSKSDKDLRLIQPKVALINGEYAKLVGISDEELREKTIYLKDIIKSELRPVDEKIEKVRQQITDEPTMDLGTKETLFAEIDKIRKERDQQLEKVLANILPQAFAVVKETARRFKENGKLVVKANEWDRQCAAMRANGFGGKAVEIDGENAVWHNTWLAAGNPVTWEMLHYDVQLIGGIVLHEGKIAEMATGEGKTLVATLPAYLNALPELGVHIVTVNDYLAKRDSEWMSPLFEFHGIRVDCIDKHQPNSPSRRNAYSSGITYGTNNEFGFDYLRDNMSREVDELVQGKLHYAMVDEVDSVLIDDARTPLIISGPVPLDLEKQEYVSLKPRVVRLVEAQQQLVREYLNEAKKKLSEKNDSEGGLALFRAYRGLPKNKPLIKYLSETGVKQKMQKVENYYLQDNSRQMPEADEPLFFTIDEKNNSIELTAKGIELITTSGEDTSFFVLPDIGTKIAHIQKDKVLDDTEKLIQIDQIKQDYAEKARRIHAINQLLKAYTLFEKDTEYIVDEGKVKIVDEQTGRVLDGRRYSDGLHQALEAKENVKIEDATQTYATVTLQNYFRMYHKLAGMTGTAETEAGEFWEIYKLDVVVIPTNRNIVRKDMEDKVYRTTREKFNAVAEEIQELTAKGRPVLVGTTSVEISETLSRMLQIRKVPHQVLNAKQHAKEADVVAFAGQSGTVTIATNMAGRGTDIKLSPESKAAGGLAIIGTERHESRRVDRQLRGRSGRQGDPGSTQFFVSLEDNLMRLFGSDRMAKVMDRLGLEEGEVIQHSMITKSIERAQKKVEENNFAIRKRLLEYDNVMNSQREVIYKRRRNALYGERLALDVMTLFYDASETIIKNNWADNEEMRLELLHDLGIILKEEELNDKTHDKILGKVYDRAYKAYQEKMQGIAQQAYQILTPFYAENGQRVKQVGIAFTDQKKIIQVVSDLEELIKTEGKSLTKNLEQAVVLAIIDQIWKEHLRDMDDLRQQVSFAHLEQKDPLLIYKFEAFELFKRFINELNTDITSFLAKVQVYHEAQEPIAVQPSVEQKPQKVQTQKAEAKSVLSTESDNSRIAQQQEVEVTKPIIAEQLPNRNDKVSVRYHDGRVLKDVKFKKVEDDFKNNLCVLI